MKNARRLLSLLIVAAAFSACSISPTGPEAMNTSALDGGPNAPPPPPIDPGGDN